MGQARPRTTDIRQATDQDIEALRATDPLLLREGFIQSGIILHLDEDDPELVFHAPARSAGPIKAPEDGF
ncbi:hypothetical protein BTR14_17160 [Rhizobium rhizosphaerae]|uniref:GNAT family N-acetyltransferase n=1 Tax=Xaviernesmea rhizosphaerae TaxID=1672749 RepID=A0ABX3P9K5_9HYPH|nr:hypothetical protein [Xaviernesmea rhizosphaerae]OQP85090.1 hypothetical protein BTR14_17160 [Xaviernesmea rhizosphaerae]